jgi:hypothetical protein
MYQDISSYQSDIQQNRVCRNVQNISAKITIISTDFKGVRVLTSNHKLELPHNEFEMSQNIEIIHNLFSTTQILICYCLCSFLV